MVINKLATIAQAMSKECPETDTIENIVFSAFIKECQEKYGMQQLERTQKKRVYRLFLSNTLDYDDSMDCMMHLNHLRKGIDSVTTRINEVVEEVLDAWQEGAFRHGIPCVIGDQDCLEIHSRCRESSLKKWVESGNKNRVLGDVRADDCIRICFDMITIKITSILFF